MTVSKKGIEQLKNDEGFTSKAKNLTLQSGKKERVKTIGYGYNISASADPVEDLVRSGVPEEDAHKVLSGELEITKDQGDLLFRISLRRAQEDAQRVIPGYDRLPSEMQDVFVNMSYQLGAKGLREFRKMRANLVKGDYKGVAKEILNSRFAREQATNRAQRLAKQVVSVGNKIEKETPKVVKQGSKETYSQQVRASQVQTVASYLDREHFVKGVARALTTMSSDKAQGKNTKGEVAKPAEEKMKEEETP